MKYGKRIAIIILIWIVSLVALTYGLRIFSINYSSESNTKAVETIMTKMKSELYHLMVDDGDIRFDFDDENRAKGRMVRILQDHGHEDTVPGKERLRKYRKLIGASYIAVKDPDGKTVSEVGKRSEGYVRNVDVIKDGDYETTFEIIEGLTETAGFHTELQDGYDLYYEMDYTDENEIADDSFSWKTLLQEVSLPDNTGFIAVSKLNGTVLVHPDDRLVGKNIMDLGIGTVSDLEKMYGKENEEGIRWAENTESKAWRNSKLLRSTKISAMADYVNVYLICSVTEQAFSKYINQAVSILPMFYAIGSLIVLLYIIFYINGLRRKEKETGEGYPGSEDTGREAFGGFMIDSEWARKLGVVCILVFLIVTVVTLQFQLLSNMSRNDSDKINNEEMVKESKKTVAETRETLDRWYRERGEDLAKLTSYILQTDDSLKTRKSLKRIEKELMLGGIYLFRQDGTCEVTSTSFDHRNIRKERKLAISKVLLPLLDGEPSEAWTPLKDEDSGEKTIYAGVSIRNSSDLCDGCLGIVKNIPESLTFENSTFSVQKDIIRMNARMNSRLELITASQLESSGYLAIILLVTLLLMFAAGILVSKESAEKAGVTADDDHDGGATENLGNGNTSSEEDSFAGSRHHMDFEEWFATITKNGRDNYFLERWHMDMSSIARRSPEKKLMILLRFLLLVMAFGIIIRMFMTGINEQDTSLVGDLFRGDWEHGFNLYAFTAAEMIVVVSIAAAILLHRLMFLIALFCSERGETICILASSLITYAIIFIAGFYILHIFGIDPRTMLVSAGVLGIVIGFGANTMIADILAGIFLIFEDVIHVGDFISVGGNYGVVMSIGVRMTKIQYYSEVTSINNSEMKGIVNLTGDVSRVLCRIPIDSAEDLNHVEKILETELPVVEKNLRKTGMINGDLWYDHVESINEQGYYLRFQIRCPSYYNMRVMRMLNAELLKMFHRNNIKPVRAHVMIEDQSTDKDAEKAD